MSFESSHWFEISVTDHSSTGIPLNQNVFYFLIVHESLRFDYDKSYPKSQAQKEILNEIISELESMKREIQDE